MSKNDGGPAVPSDRQACTPAPADGEKCDDCGRHYSLVYRVPDHVWEKIAPKPVEGFKGGGLLCPDCAARRATDFGIVLYFDAAAGWWREDEPTPAPAPAEGEVSELETALVIVTRLQASAAYLELHGNDDGLIGSACLDAAALLTRLSAQQDAVRRETIEECALVAVAYGDDPQDRSGDLPTGWASCRSMIAAAIRALKGCA